MKCEEKVGQYCRQAVKLEKYVQYRRCNKCCYDCLEPCSFLCDKAQEFKNMAIYENPELLEE